MIHDIIWYHIQYRATSFRNVIFRRNIAERVYRQLIPTHFIIANWMFLPSWTFMGCTLKASSTVGKWEIAVDKMQFDSSELGKRAEQQHIRSLPSTGGAAMPSKVGRSCKHLQTVTVDLGRLEHPLFASLQHCRRHFLKPSSWERSRRNGSALRNWKRSLKRLVRHRGSAQGWLVLCKSRLFLLPIYAYLHHRISSSPFQSIPGTPRFHGFFHQSCQVLASKQDKQAREPKASVHAWACRILIQDDSRSLKDFIEDCLHMWRSKSRLQAQSAGLHQLVQNLQVKYEGANIKFSSQCFRKAESQKTRASIKMSLDETMPLEDPRSSDVENHIENKEPHHDASNFVWREEDSLEPGLHGCHINVPILKKRRWRKYMADVAA